jgi:streptogramin lyase
MAALLVTAGFVGVYLSRGGGNPCDPLGGNSVLKSQVSGQSFGAVTNFALPSPDRYPNAPTVAQDGSLWFAEETVPAFGHLFPQNGTLVEYAWPEPTATQTRIGSCQFKTNAWGVAVWNGSVWGTDSEQNRLVALGLSDHTFRVITLPAGFASPYTLTASPDGSLWFTMLNSPPSLGRVSADGTASFYTLTNDSKFIPSDLYFLNRTVAYFSGLQTGASGGALFQFNPSSPGTVLSVQQLGSGFSLNSPTSVARVGDDLWLTQHGAASLARYNPINGWTVFPTSTVNYSYTTLPYFIKTDGQSIWFNEHIGNKIVHLDPARVTLTEFSEASPPVTNSSSIGNALTLALAGDKVWFAELTGNVVGFVDKAHPPAFSLTSSSSSISVTAGGSAKVQLQVTDNSARPLAIQFSDSEGYTSIPQKLSMLPSPRSIASLSGTYQVNLTISAAANTAPGQYTVLATVGDGLLQQSVYLFVKVS